MPSTLSQVLAVSAPVDLAAIDSRSTPGFDGDKQAGVDALATLAGELAELQEKLHAGGRADQTSAKVLVVLQGMDTSGKGGTLRNVAGLVDPQGVHLTAFGRPTPEELERDFLWRIEQRLPAPGMIGVFDRSHYEDVLIGRVRGLVDGAEIERRYGAINDFEQAFVDGGGVIVKCLLHISPDDQAERLAERLDDPTKLWKFDPSDLDDRELWHEYQRAYEIAIERCSIDAAPWHVVPAGRKWYRNWAIATLLTEALRGLGLDWPQADFDVDAAKARLATLARIPETA